MNQNTLWLQVPAAQPHQTNSLSFKNNIQSINKTSVILYIADHGIVIDSETKLFFPITSDEIKKHSPQSELNKDLTNNSNTRVEPINLGTKNNLFKNADIIHSTVNSNSNNICIGPAMNHQQLTKAINIGRQTAQKIKRRGENIFIAEAINNANSISATAITCALLNISPNDLYDLNDEQILLVNKALKNNKTMNASTLDILRYFGSFEIAALTGSYLCCAHMGLPVLINSFPSAAAALIAARLCPNAEQWFLLVQTNKNMAHKYILEFLDTQSSFNKNTVIARE